MGYPSFGKTVKSGLGKGKINQALWDTSFTLLSGNFSEKVLRRGTEETGIDHFFRVCYIGTGNVNPKS